MKPEIGRYSLLTTRPEWFAFPRREPERFRKLAWKEERHLGDWLIGWIGIIGLLLFLLFFRVMPALAFL
jgi:hypothetical protein